MQRNKPGYQYTRHDRNFFEESMNEEWDRNLTGTRVEYVEPEGSEAHLSMLSLDDEPEPETEIDANDDNTSANPHIGPKKAKFKKMAKRLYPAKVVGGAKALGGAIRHPMVTGRKVNGFVRRKNGATTTTRGDVLVDGWDFPETTTTDGLPPLTRCATVSEREMFTQASTPSTPGTIS